MVDKSLIFAEKRPQKDLQMIKKIGFVLFILFNLLFTTKTFAGYDDGESTYFYSGIPGCGCFYHCNCYHYSVNGFSQFNRRWHPDTIDEQIWHRFMEKYLYSYENGPYVSEHFLKKFLEGGHDGYICLLSEYLNAIELLKEAQEKSRNNTLHSLKVQHRHPTEQELLAKKIQVLDDKARQSQANLATIPETIIPMYKVLVSDCPHDEPYNMVLMYNRGLVGFLEGDIGSSLNDIVGFIDAAERLDKKHLLTSEIFQKQGQGYFEVGLYHDAIKSLDEAIAKNPNNLEAYFHRALSYYETGDFDNALGDYLISKKKNHFQLHPLPENEFIDAFAEATFKGAQESLEDFLPCLCNSAYGLGECLWTFCDCPLESISTLAGASYEMGEQVVKYFKTLDKEKLSAYADEIVEYYEKYDQLSKAEKGALFGHMLGKYGTDFFTSTMAIKAVSAYRTLKAANAACNLEAMLASQTGKEVILAKSAQQAAKRASFFENVKIQYDKQNKHVVGSRTYIEGKSLFEHRDPEKLLRKHAGKGVRKTGTMGEGGYKEVVDFGEHVGKWKSEAGELIPTNLGTIHYAQDGGAHIVPEKPDYLSIWRQRNGQ